jgi:2-C-methyl-D-erythritol 4-phosphate cytidylyltransferase
MGEYFGFQDALQQKCVAADNGVLPEHAMSRHFALIPAAGTGSRMESSSPKQYLPLLGRPLIAHTLIALSRDPRIDRIVVVLSPDDGLWQGHDWSPWQDRLVVLRCGGASRAESVLNGLDAMSHWCAEDDWVLVHDAARPCLPRSALARLIDEAGADAVGALLAVPVADTLKRADQQGRVSATEPRAGLWQAQTPQMFRHGLLREALRAAGSDVTDDASAIEKAGLRPLLVEADSRNLKVTYPRDLQLAQLILENLDD